LILQSEVAHDFQRLFNLKMGYGTRKYDTIRYRAMGPVTEEKAEALRAYREEQYQKLCDAVYNRRGWDSNGVPTLETVKRLKIDFPDVLKLLKC
jgi:aldehyde:ferredoxin oxidoreductase